MFVIPSGSVTCLFDLIYSGVDAKGIFLKGINQVKIKYDTSLNRCKGPP